MEPATEGDQAAQSKRHSGFLYHAVVSILIVLVALILRAQHPGPGCADKLNDGHWLNERRWQPSHCTLHYFQWREVGECVSRFSHVVVVGVNKWAYIANLFCPTNIDTDSQEVEEASSSSCKMQYISQSNSCAEDEQVVEEYAKLSESSDEEKGPVLVIHQPLLHFSPAKKNKKSEALQRCRGLIAAQVRAQQKLLAARPGSLVFQLDSNPVWEDEHEVGVDVTLEYRELYNRAQENASRLFYLTTPFATGLSQRMMHFTKNSPPTELSLLLNTFCSPVSTSSSCCVHSSHYTATTILVFMVAVYVGVVLILLSGATFALMPHLEAINFDLDRFVLVLHSIGGGAVVFLYILIVDGRGYFLNEEKTFNVWLFVICLVSLLLVTVLTSEKKDTSEFLSAEQCNGWRGTLVLTYIALRYCGMDQKGAGGRLVEELLVGGLVFISGYTHFTHYWNHADFSWKRLGTVLLRLNTLPVLLSLTLGTSYGAYVLPLLLSLGFLFTAAFMASWPQMTPASLQGMSLQGPQHVVVAVKFGFAFLFISFLPWMKGFIKELVSLPILGTTRAGAHILYHWIYSQRFMALGGMVFGYLMCCVQSTSASSASEGFRKLKLVTTAFSVLIILGYGIFLASAAGFEESSESQSLISQPVILSYALLRYFSKPLRRYESGFLAQLGSSSIWLFISHQHILLTQSGSVLLTLFPMLPLAADFTLTLCVFLFCQRLISFAQHTLTNYCSRVTTPPSSTGANSRTPPVTA